MFLEASKWSLRSEILNTFLLLFKSSYFACTLSTNMSLFQVKKAKDYAFVHFNTRGAAERAYEATKEHLLLDNCRVEVTWSKPIDRHIHSQRKQLSKALISGNITGKF